jgi:ubiquinone/menaquinone biosynthesis C-methylase UbiE
VPCNQQLQQMARTALIQPDRMNDTQKHPRVHMQPKEHWEEVYSTKASDAVSWYQQRADLSLQLIDATGVPRSASIIDVGGGTSTLVDDLVMRAYQNITVLDISATALETARGRLGDRARAVTWLEADITKAELPLDTQDVWHDRAVFHFLTTAEDRAAYLQAVLRSVRPRGHLIVAAFAEDGPSRCSGLPAIRYSATQLDAEFGAAFTLVSHHREAHHTPFATTQQFTYCHWRKA